MRITHVLAFLVPLAAASAPAGAQIAPEGSPGITVSGRGVVTVDADALAFDVRLGFGPRPQPAAVTPRPAPSLVPQDLGSYEAPARTLAAALTAAGARTVAITIDNTLAGNNPYPFDVTGLLDRPSHDRILGLFVSGALATLPDGSEVPVQSARGLLVVNGCDGVEARAAAAALDDAQRQATALAAHAHLRLGARTRVVALSFGAAACPRLDQMRGGGASIGFANLPLPLDGPYRIRVERDVTVTYALR